MRMFKSAIMPLVLLFACPAWAGGENAQLLDRLRADRGALEAAERDFRHLQQQENLGAIESRDYSAYLDRLRQRVADDCLALEAARVTVPADQDCPGRLSHIVRPAAIDQQAEQTDAERTAVLDAELNAELGEFDERLLREQQRVKAGKPHAAGSGSQEGAGSAAEGGQSGDLADNGDPGANGESRDSGDFTAPPPSGAAGGPGHQTTAGDQPKDIPDGSDDDVVARQLREAAERESDPELKKKLWEEYRKYKQGTR